jgi:ATP-dependent Clp protease protease subunit
MKEELNGIMAHHTGQSIKKITADTDRDYFMSSQEALEYGLIDKVMKSRADVDESIKG